MDIGGKRHRAVSFQGRARRGAGRLKSQRHFAALVLFLDKGAEIAGEFDAVAGFQAAARPGEGSPTIGR